MGLEGLGGRTEQITPKQITFIASFGGPGDLSASGGGFGCCTN